MQDITVRDLVEFCGGTLLCGDPDTPAEHISLDSRSMRGNDLFVPLVGEKTDAHRFIRQAFDNGAVAALTGEHGTGEGKQPVPAGEDRTPGYGRAWIGVEDTKTALQAIGRAYRARLDLPLIGITGSVGKTTAKEMTAAALSGGLRVFKTAGSRNSQVSVPVTLTDISREDEAGVIELGMSEPGELTVIARMARVDVAAVTNIGPVHLEHLGSQENILREKLTIQDGLKEGGVLLLNGDDPLLKNVKARPGFRAVFFGTGENCDYRAEKIVMRNGYASFQIRGVPVRLGVPGAHQVPNAVLAMAAADLFGVPLRAAARSLGEFRGIKGRDQIYKLGGVTLMDDSYNANPVSMRGAIDILSSAENCTRRIAVLADMKELGPDSARYHREIGEYAGGRPVDLLITFGELAEEIGKGALTVRPGLAVRHFDESRKEEMEAWILTNLRDGDCILFKGSNSMKLGETAEHVICQYHH